MSGVRNKRMGVLTGIAILLVVLGHLDMNELSVFGLFPYYGFHVQVFLFVSGYFYDDRDEGHVGQYVLRKAKRLLLPYFVCGLIYGLISTVLSGQGFAYCQPFSAFNYLVDPWLGGHAFGLNFAAWFIPALFAVEVINVLARKLLGFIRSIAVKDVLAFAVTLLLGIVTVYLAKTGHVWGYYKTPGRILIMLPMFEFGRLYKTVLERHEKRLPAAAALGIAALVQFIAYLSAHGSLNYSIVWCTSFAGAPFIPFVTAICGTWWWLRVSDLLRDTGIGSRLDRLGECSYHVCMHHVAVFWLINLVTMYVCGLVRPEAAFDLMEYKTNVNYVYQVMGLYAWRMVYLIAAVVGIPLVCSIFPRRRN